MPPRDPELTEHNKADKELTEYLKTIESDALAASDRTNLQSLHAAYGGKHDQFINIKDAVIHTPEQFVKLWFQGYMKVIDNMSDYQRKNSALSKSFTLIQKSDILCDYVIHFLKRTFHRNYRSLIKKRPDYYNAYYWIGQERASYGIFVTPVFKEHDKQWANDKSEIRHFRPQYWTIGHILKTGLQIPHKDKSLRFEDVDQYLTFFEHTLVRQSGSEHEAAIAERYCNFVRDEGCNLDIPLLIPEIRYAGIETKHKYRLDFCIIREETNEKIGFELSPWSTHGKITGTKDKKQYEINDEAKENFEKEMKKLKRYFRDLGIYTIIYTDTDFQDYDKIFEQIKEYLSPVTVEKQLSLSVMEDFKNYEV